MENKLGELLIRYRKLGVNNQIDYDKFYLYSLITNSTAIEGSTITELENQTMFDLGVSPKEKSLEEVNMNLDLKSAYEMAIEFAKQHKPFSIEMLIYLSSLVMKNTGQEYKTARGNFSSAKGELRMLNLTAGSGNRSYISYSKIPSKLSQFCKRLNAERAKASTMSIDELYRLTFNAHYNLVTLHPWADGSGRMARLVMNMLQFEFGLIPTKIPKEDTDEYINALIVAQETNDIDIFRDYMFSLMEQNILNEIATFLEHIGKIEIGGLYEVIEPENYNEMGFNFKPIKNRDKIIALLKEDSKLSASAISKIIGVSTKTVEKHFGRLKANGFIERIGPAKGGYWKVK